MHNKQVCLCPVCKLLWLEDHAQKTQTKWGEGKEKVKHEQKQKIFKYKYSKDNKQETKPSLGKK